MPRLILIVLDGVGAGEMPDSAEYGDSGANTLGHIARAEGGLRLPNMQALGLGNIIPIEGVPPAVSPRASHGRMMELSKGKDTITGHWEMMGLVTERPFPTYPHGFPQEIIERLRSITGRDILCNRPASGTAVIEQYGDEHMRTGSPIVYTSADSVFQIAAHEDVIPAEGLYDICRSARKVLVPPHNVCRVIARPFTGPPFVRTPRRRDFPVEPHGMTVPDLMEERNLNVISIGKVADMFTGRGFTGGYRTKDNAEGMRMIDLAMETCPDGLIFANLVDFDTKYGHRKDIAGFHAALREFDAWLGGLMGRLCPEDHVAITADHGLDPTHPGTDHTREHVPILLFGPRVKPQDLGLRHGFSDIGATIAELFGLPGVPGLSMLQ